MFRSITELMVIGAAASILAVLVLVCGNTIVALAAMPPVAPSSVKTAGDVEQACLDAPVIAHAAASVTGEARLCLTGRDLFATARVSGLRAGAVYTAWLGYVRQPGLCRDASCGPIDLLGDTPIGLLERIDGGVVPPSGTLELAGELRDLEISSGAQVSLLLMRPRKPDLAHAEAVFIVP